MNIRCIALDLDYTLSHFQGRYEGLFKIFRKRGAAEHVIQNAYRDAKTDGFTIEKLIDLVAARGVPLDHSPILDEFRAWLAESITLYPDALPFLERVRNALHLPVAIVTFGHPSHQTEKIRLLKFPYDEFICTTDLRKKYKPLKELAERRGAPLLYVDDSNEELDFIHEQDPHQTEIITAHIVRPDAPHRDDTTRFAHIHISSLNELFPHVLQ